MVHRRSQRWRGERRSRRLPRGRLGRTLADDVSWHTPGANVLAGDYHGRAAVIEYLRKDWN
jgi:hypothetical protein